MAVSRFGRFILQTLLIAMATVASVLLVACSSANPSGGAAWEPTDEDPVYTDENGVTWGIPYHREGSPEYSWTNPDMLWTQGDDGVVGYVSLEEQDAAVWQADEDYAGIPGKHDVYVTTNLYEFLTYEVIGTDTFHTTATVEAGASEQDAGGWYPKYPDEVSTTDDGRTWGANLVGSSCDMLHVMASDTGVYGFVSSSELEEAETEAMLEVSRSGKTSTVMIDVVLYDSDTVVGQYAVTAYA